MAHSIPTVQIQNPENKDRFLIINEGDFDFRKHKLWKDVIESRLKADEKDRLKLEARAEAEAEAEMEARKARMKAELEAKIRAEIEAESKDKAKPRAGQAKDK